MEELNVNSNSGQGYGFILYRTQMKTARTFQVKGRIYDRVIILVKSKPVREEGGQIGMVTSTIEDPIFSLSFADV